MTRYDDRYDERNGPTKLYVGRLSSRTRSRDLEDLFRKYGRVREVDVKHDFAFIEFSDSRDADDARHYMNGKEVDGSRIIVEFAKRGPRGPGGGGGGGGGSGGGREYLGRGPPDAGRCYNCGNEGHWARDCKAGDWKDKCYRCGQRGHIERNCRNSPRASSRYNRSASRSLSRSPSRDRHKRRSRSHSRSYSRSPNRVSRSPLKDNRARSLSPSPGQKYSRSRSPSPTADRRSPHCSPLPHSTRRSVSGSPRKDMTPLSGAENGN